MDAAATRKRVPYDLLPNNGCQSATAAGTHAASAACAAYRNTVLVLDCQRLHAYGSICEFVESGCMCADDFLAQQAFLRLDR